MVVGGAARSRRTLIDPAGPLLSHCSHHRHDEGDDNHDHDVQDDLEVLRMIQQGHCLFIVLILRVMKIDGCTQLT